MATRGRSRSKGQDAAETILVLEKTSEILSKDEGNAVEKLACYTPGDAEANFQQLNADPLAKRRRRENVEQTVERQMGALDLTAQNSAFL